MDETFPQTIFGWLSYKNKQNIKADIKADIKMQEALRGHRSNSAFNSTKGFEGLSTGLMAALQPLHVKQYVGMENRQLKQTVGEFNGLIHFLRLHRQQNKWSKKNWNK